MMLNSIKIKVLASQLASVLLAMFFMWIASYFLMVNYLSISQKRNLQYFVDFKVKEIENYFTQIEALMERTTDSREFRDFHITFRNLAMIELFTRFNRMFPTVAYVNKEGQEEVKIEKGKLSDRPLINISKDPTFQNSLRQHNKVIISPVEPNAELGEPAIRLMLSKYAYFGDEFMGALVGTIPLSQIGDILKDRIGEFGFISLIDNNGAILSYPEKDKILGPLTGKGKGAEKLIADSKRLNAGFGRADILGVDGFVAYAPLKEMGWSVLVTLPYQEFMAEPNKLGKIFTVIFIIIFVISIIISFNLSRGVTSPILKLATLTTKIAAGDFSKRVEIESKDEIGQLAEAFNAMIEDLQKTTVSWDEMAKEVAERQRIEDTLKKKINELEDFHKLTIDRELKMVELKNEIEELKARLKEK